LQREHNETLAKLNFVLALTDCILEVADMRCAPLSALMSAGESPSVQNLTQPHAPEHCKRAERLILLIRALQLLSSGLNLASQQLQAGNLKPSNTVKNGKSTEADNKSADVVINYLFVIFSSFNNELEIPIDAQRVEEAQREWPPAKGNSQPHHR